MESSILKVVNKARTTVWKSTVTRKWNVTFHTVSETGNNTTGTIECKSKQAAKDLACSILDNARQ